MSDRANHTEFDELTAFQAGNEAVVARISNHHVTGIYSYLLARSGDEDTATRATEEAFRRASTAALPPEGDLDTKTWLFLNARDTARSGGMSFAAIEASDGDDLRSLGLEAVSGLAVRDRDMMTLAATGQLDDDQLARVMGLDPSHADDVIAKSRRRVEGALGALLVARFGTHECDDLRGLIGDWTGSFGSDVRASVNRHVTTCDVCRSNRGALVGTGAVLPQLFTVEAPPELPNRIIDELTVAPEPAPESVPVEEPPPVAETPPPSPVPAAPASAPSLSTESDSRDLMMLGVFIVLAIVLGLIGFAVANRFSPLDVPEPTGAPSTILEGTGTTTTTAPGPVSTTRASSPPSTLEVSASPASLGVSATSVDFGGDDTTAQFDIINSGGRSGEVAIEASDGAVLLGTRIVVVDAGESATFDVAIDRSLVSEGDIDESIRLTWDGGQIEVAVTGSQFDNPIVHNPRASPPSVAVDGDAACTNTQTTVSARITDTSPFQAVVRWSPDGGGTQETSMTEVGGDIYEAEVGPFTVPQAATVRIVATDEVGNLGGAPVSVSVAPCP